MAQMRREKAQFLRERFNWLAQFSDEELEQICFCETGAEMVPGEAYVDISHPENGPFIGRQGQIVPEGGCLVRQDEVSPVIWTKLTSFGKAA